ncbi:carbon-nitrogen hydrolase family protein, partial [Devosia psychrophila]|uniref:carbon-nitrogen hydrolase family protein n=1 Tax=Devosia psychrophila TaxID=728005 RepID=UPI0020BF7133
MTLPMAMVFPALWSVAGSRAGAALVAAAYFLGASRGLPEGVSIFFGSDRLLGIALWVTASLVFVGTHAACWTKRSGWRQPWRYLLANVLMSVPPLGILGWANPITAAGIMLPGWGWWGLAMTMVLLMSSVSTRLRWLAIAVIGALSISASMNWTEPAPPSSWRGIDTSFVTGREQYADYAQQRVTIHLVQAAAVDGAKVVVLPESAFGIWTPTAEALWSGALANFQVTVIGGAIILAGDGYENLMISVTAKGAEVLYRQRMPVPVSMWQPWSTGGAAADFFGNPVVEHTGV